MVFGGELNDVKNVDFKDLSKLDVVGFFPSYATAHTAWQGKARETIDNAQMGAMITEVDLNGKTVEAVVADWMAANEPVWSGWLAK